MSKDTRKVVAESEDVSAQQMKDFWRKVADGTINGCGFQRFLDNSNEFLIGSQKESVVRPTTVTNAKKILGRHKVVGTGTGAIRYTAATLQQAAAENKNGCDWRLVYFSGHSIRQQRDLLGTDRNKQPCHRLDNTWHLNASEDGWAKNAPEAGWHLIDFNGRWGGKTWDNQEVELQKLGSQFARVDPHVFGEAVTSIYSAGDKERIAENWVHWSGSADSHGCFVWVGNFHAYGLLVAGLHRGSSHSRLRVCVVRKFDA